MGAMIGIGGGYLIAIFQWLHHRGSEQSSEVVMSIATLRKLEKSDTESACRLLRIVIADNYLQHTDVTNSWWMCIVYRNSELISQVEMAADELPSLKQAIEEQRAKRELFKMPNNTRPDNPH